MKTINIRGFVSTILLAIVFSFTLSINADSIFFEGFEEYTTTDPTNWTRSATERIYVVSDKAASGLKSVFCRHSGTRYLTLKDSAKIDVTPGTTLIISYKMCQYNTDYESTDYTKFLLKFGTDDLEQVIYDAAKLDGCGSASSPVNYTGTRIDLPSTTGRQTTFITYYIKVTVPNDRDSLILQFITNSGSDNENFWIDDINVDQTILGTCVIIQ